MQDQWRLNVKLRSTKSLREFMAFQNLDTAYAVAKKAGILPGTVGHLVSGRRNTCSLRTARAIEEALGCPPGFLFDAEMSKIATDSRRQRTAA